MTAARELASHGPEETAAIAADLAAGLDPPRVVALHGDLGAGKTVFARGFARALGVADPVTSPTFTIVQEYRGARAHLYHIDLYRLTDSLAALDFGIEDYLDDPTAFCLVEWPERALDILPHDRIEVHFATGPGPTDRRLRILRPPGGNGQPSGYSNPSPSQ